MTIVQGNKRFSESQFGLEEEFEELIRSQSRVLFGKDTIYINTKSKLKGVFLGATISDLAPEEVADRCHDAGGRRSRDHETSCSQEII